MFIFRSVSPTDVLLYLKTKLWNLCINSMSLFAFTDPRISHSHLRSITLNTVILSELHSTVKAGVTGEPCGIRHWTCRHSHSSGSFTVKQCSVGTTRRKTDYWQLNRWQCSCCFPKMPMNRWKVRAGGGSTFTPHKMVTKVAEWCGRQQCTKLFNFPSTEKSKQSEQKHMQ